MSLLSSAMARINTSVRIVDDRLRERSLQETYWAFSRTAAQMSKLLKPDNRQFMRVVAEDMKDFIVGVRPIRGEARDRASAVVKWLLYAQERTNCGGVALGLFPCDGGAAWLAPYPETTGYIITSLLRYAVQRNDNAVRLRAIEMADWEIGIQMPNGAVQGGQYIPSVPQTPCAFNTGMVLDGWCSAYEATRELRFAEAARRATDYLINDLTEDGYFRTNGQFVKPDLIKTYNCLCAWGIYRLGVLVSEPNYKFHATRVVEAAIRQQRSNGWFENNCLTRSDAPLLHTISYTLQGILEVGLASGREDFVDAVRLGVDPLLLRIRSNGFLPGRYYSNWEAASFSSCLTGSAQLAVICYRLFQHTKRDAYRTAGDQLVNFLKPLQRLKPSYPDVSGALPGSFPIFGEYMTAGYPNWASKYLLDALMLQTELSPA